MSDNKKYNVSFSFDGKDLVADIGGELHFVPDQIKDHLVDRFSRTLEDNQRTINQLRDQLHQEQKKGIELERCKIVHDLAVKLFREEYN